ncbi:MAG: CHAT domain-containing protein [Acidovorax sp.]|uniref:CHAT domain-containing protein n=1 Tax=Acidovorax sp. TaxID=1872122 RepID=UPI00391BD50E
MPSDVEDTQTIFQGFSLVLLPDYLTIISAITRFPHDMLEACLVGHRLVGSKMAGSDLNVRMLRVDLLDSIHCELEHFPTVIWSTERTAAGVAENLRNFKIAPLHLTLGKYEGAIAISSLTAESIQQHLIALAERAVAAEGNFVELLELMRAHPARAERAAALPFKPRLHNSTRPMADVLMSYGFDFKDGEEISPSPDTTPYVASMVEMATLIDQLREEQPPLVHLARKNDAIVFCPSIMAQMYGTEFWNQYLRDLPKHKRDFVKNMLLRNKGYSNGTISTDDEFFNPYEDPTVGPMLKLRQFELRYFTELISLIAVNQFAPAFRLPGAVMLHHGVLGEIYALVNSNKRSRLKELNRRVAGYGKQLKEEVGEELLRAIFDDREKLLLICDFPAEWLPIDLVPAMFRYQISRVPPTPGNVASHVLLSGPRLVLPCSALNSVLVIRSFKENDPLSGHLTHAIQAYGLKSVNVQFVDVKTKEEIITAMNGFEGAIVVFDCHGNHGGKAEHGWLNIGKENVDVWNLANLARMPPIVILAACSTHALDGSHASVANGFLRSGVLSVLGTYAPVHSVHTAVLVGRLIYRIDAFLPLLAQHRPVTWRELVSGFFRMSYVTDVLRDLYEVRGLLDESQYRAIHLEANQAINGYKEDWIEQLQKSVMEATNKTQAEVLDLWESSFQFVETMLFTQLGRPENIIIVSDDEFGIEGDTAIGGT